MFCFASIETKIPGISDWMFVSQMKYLMDHDVDLVNYSYGEAAHVCNSGYVYWIYDCVRPSYDMW